MVRLTTHLRISELVESIWGPTDHVRLKNNREQFFRENRLHYCHSTLDSNFIKYLSYLVRFDTSFKNKLQNEFKYRVLPQHRRATRTVSLFESSARRS